MASEPLSIALAWRRCGLTNMLKHVCTIKPERSSWYARGRDVEKRISSNVECLSCAGLLRALSMHVCVLIKKNS
eukprot:jgi/Botrbrau1/22824/Bobra.0132s0147.1